LTKPDSGQCDWPWWYSTDQERYNGPCADRAEAIVEASAEWPDTAHVHVMQAVHVKVVTDIFDGDRIAEMFDDANEENADGEGDSLSSEITDKEWSDLAAQCGRLVAGLVRRRGVTAWRFAEQTEGEWIDLRIPLIAGLPRLALDALSDIARARNEGAPLRDDDLAREIKRIGDALLADGGA
jgi:hypothetical protein